MDWILVELVMSGATDASASIQLIGFGLGASDAGLSPY